jgi:hypothetical protein
MSEVKRYKVTGRGPFPIDMLRYDRVYPASEGDSYTMGGEIGADQGSRTVEVEGRGCTPARWLSFLWAVVVDEDQA